MAPERSKRADPERAVRQAIVTGELVDLRARQPEADNPACGATWKRRRTVRAEILAELLTRGGNGPSPPQSLRLTGARIVGVLNLESKELVCPVLLSGCWFEEPVNLAEAQAVVVRLPGCYLPAFNAQQLATRGNLELNEGFTANGEVSLNGARIRGTLDLSGASLTNPGGFALNADGITVDQYLLGRGLHAQGEVRLLGGHVEGQISLRGATLSNPEALTLNADKLTVGQGLYCRRFSSQGKVVLAGAHVGGLDWGGASVVNAHKVAVAAEGLTVDHDMSCTEEEGEAFTAEGEISMLGASIGGTLSFEEAKLTNPGRTVLDANRLTVGQSMYCRGKFDAKGEINLIGASIGGTLSFKEAKLSNPSNRVLTADGVKVGRNLDCVGLEAEGEVDLEGANIGGWLQFNRARLVNPERVAVNLERASVMQNVFMQPACIDGELNLAAARVGGWHDKKEIWEKKPPNTRLSGFVYETIEGRDAEGKEFAVEDRLRLWLPKGDKYSPQPYEQLAEVYRRVGSEQARIVAIGKQRARRDAVRGWARWPSKVWSALLRWMIGYGYRPARALIPLTVLLIAGTVIFAVAYPGQLHPAKTGSEQPGFNSFRYTLDLLLPVANFKQRDAFVASGWIAWLSFVFTFVGWLLGAVVVAGLAGVFKRD
jgi:hypothetical protein